MTEDNLNPEKGPEPIDGAQEPAEAPAPPTGTFGEAADEMANETEVEESRSVEDELAAATKALEERTADLQRLQAEYVNYKRRVDRDRELVRQNATYAALAPIIEVLDTIDRAREHGPLEGGFKAVADQLERTVAGLGLVKFGEVGEPFDPSRHEALSHIGEDPEVEVTTCKVIAKSGYLIGDRVVRAAQVLVVDPASGPSPGTTESVEESAAGATDQPTGEPTGAQPEEEVENE